MVYSSKSSSILSFIPRQTRFGVSSKVREEWEAASIKSQTEGIEYGGYLIARKTIFYEKQRHDRPNSGKKSLAFQICFASVEKGKRNSFIRLGQSAGISLVHIANYSGIQLDDSDIVYCGEWHSHPVNLFPSSDDLAFFKERSKEAVLFLVSPSGFRVITWDTHHNTTFVSRVYDFKENPYFRKSV